MKHIILVLIGIVILSSCDSNDTTNKTPEQIQAEIEASQKKFAEERKRIELENKAQLEKVEYQRSLVSARFVSVDDEKISVELINNTDKNIDNISGSLDIMNQNGDYVTGVGLTYWVTGQIYLPVGKTAEAQKVLKLISESERTKIITEAESYNYYFTTIRYQYEDEAEINLTQTNTQPVENTKESVVATENKPESTTKSIKTPPESCGSNQVSVMINDLYYPGPKCSHVSRNIDSQRFMQKHILLCQETTQATSPPPSAARVRIAECGPAQGRAGISYSKQICCDLP